MKNASENIRDHRMKKVCRECGNGEYELIGEQVKEVIGVIYSVSEFMLQDWAINHNIEI